MGMPQDEVIHTIKDAKAELPTEQPAAEKQPEAAPVATTEEKKEE